MTSSATALPDPAAVLTLRAGTLCVDLAPAVGGSIARFYSQLDAVQHDWLRPATAADIANRVAEGMASFPLAPFCNRLRNGRARFGDCDIALPPNRNGSPHAIHGHGWQRPWQVTAQDARSATMELNHAGGDWPFPFHAWQKIALDADRLSVTITVENRGTQPMPLGLGHHPYLPRRHAARLTVAVDAMWGGDAEVMPTELVHPPLLAQLRSGVALREVDQDNNFIGWNHRARVDWPAEPDQPRASSLTLGAAAPLDFFVLYSPPEYDFFCIEPVSNCTDWLNLAGYTQQQVGGSVVAPGATCSATFWLQPGWG
jgi:aldose 1-epimerase